MACVGPSRLRWGTLLSVVLCVFAQENSWECLDKDKVITEMSKDVDLPSECVLTCTVLTYRQIVDSRQKLTVRFKDSQPGESGDFCWLIHTRCSTWEEVFVLLSLNQSDPSGETVRLQTNSLTHTNPVLPHGSSSVLPDDCGFRFDVTPHLRDRRQRVLCVQLDGIMGNRLQCPPFLVIVRQKQSKSLARS